MALSANSVFEVRTTGNDTNGGGFVTGSSGTDYSQQDIKNSGGNDSSTTDAVANGTTTITSATASFQTSIVGNIIYLQGGTGGLAAGWYQVTARASTTSITVDRNVATGTGITMNIGGALASLGRAGNVGLVSGGIIYVKAGTYTITSASTNVSNGCFSASLALIVIEGYENSRGDFGTAPLLQASGISTFTIIASSGADSAIYNISVDGAGLTSSRGFFIRSSGFKLTALNCTNNGFREDSATVFDRCIASGCSSQSAFFGGVFINCIAYDNTITGFELSSSRSTAIRCISDSNSGASSDGFELNGAQAIINCVAYNNGRDGIRTTGDSNDIINCIVDDNAAFGINGNSRTSIVLINCAGYSNASGEIGNLTGKGCKDIGFVTLTGSPFTDAANQDFSLNNTASAGASCRAAGYPGVLPIGGTGYLDIGTLQHQDSGGSGRTLFIPVE